MSKSAIILSTPNSCRECPIKQIKVLGKVPVYACLLSKKIIISDGDINCPLKEIPEPIPFASDDYSKGYNEAIENLTHI